MSALSVGPRRGHPAGLPEEPLWRQDAGEPLQAPTPAQVVGQVLGRNPVAAVPPSGPSAVISVDVLNRAGVVHHPHPGTAVHGLLGEVQLRGQGDVDGAAIGAPYPIGVQERLQDGAYRWGMGAGQDRSGGRRGTRSRAINTGSGASDSPRVAAGPPRWRAGRGRSRRPVNAARPSVSAAATRPGSGDGWASDRWASNRCRPRQAVFW